MRLLELKDSGEFSLTKNLIDNIPPYAILSHTWGADEEEVTFQELTEGTGGSKVGYRKIQFCGDQAAHDGLRYIWVDTCCINKADNSELSEAINSMFRWYRNATKCYVYLSDVSINSPHDHFSQSTWEPAFRKSRWFTRGWTLQELLAPPSVEFFCREGKQLGDKKSLELMVHQITGIAIPALRGSPLSHFGVAERMSWAAKRQTQRKEDEAYCLLGIFDIHMPLIYGEGTEAFIRLQKEIESLSMNNTFARSYQTGIDLPAHQSDEDFSITFSLSQVSETEQFVARDKELASIHRTLVGSDGSRRTVVLHGLGGIGKTQLAIAYTKRYKADYSAIFWLNIKDEDSLKLSFVAAARRILRDHPSATGLSSVHLAGNLDEVVDAVKAWLSIPRNTRWLVVYDNYDNPKLPGNPDPSAVDIQKYLPESYHGSVIITTRSSQVKIGRRIRVGKLENIEHSLEILSNTSGRDGAMNGESIQHLWM